MADALLPPINSAFSDKGVKSAFARRHEQARLPRTFFWPPRVVQISLPEIELLCSLSGKRCMCRERIPHCSLANPGSPDLSSGAR